MGNAPTNRFKERLVQGEQLIGLWSTLGDGVVAELLAGCGYDWILIDAEHGPNDLRAVLAQLQGLAAGERFFSPAMGEFSQPVVRLRSASPELIKQYLDVGAKNLLIPMIDTAEQAEAAVRAARYAPYGIRGMGSGIARSSGWGRYTDYVATAVESTCIIVQAESRTALANLEAIAAVDGVDGVLFGPSDLAADLGHGTDRNHPEVVAAIQHGIAQLAALGVPAGIMVADRDQARFWLGHGITFAGIGVDSSLLVAAAQTLLAEVTGGVATRTDAY